MNLVISLNRKVKPIHQYMDRVSLDWISEHSISKSPKDFLLPRNFINFIDKYQPWGILKKDAFKNDLIYQGIHGFRHCVRVAINSVYIATTLGIKNQNKLIQILYSGLFHDCQRLNDNSDINHGVRSAKWVVKNQNVIPKQIKKSIFKITFPIEVHVDKYEKIKLNKKYYKNKIEVDILKTADAIDRFRFPRTDWWINTNYLELSPLKKHLRFGFYLMLWTEDNYLSLNKNSSAFYFAWDKIKNP